jgi:hypothetical protein
MDIVSNRFGTVAADRVTFSLKKGWFSGSLKSDYLTKHITSIALDVSRRPIWGAIFALAGSWAMTSSLMFMGIFLFLIGVYFVLGRPAIHFATAGGERIISYGAWPWQQAEAQQFVDALKKELFKQGAAS